MNNIRLTIVENDTLIANLLQGFFDKTHGFEVVNVFYDGASFLESTHESYIADILLLDLKMSDVSGVDVIEELKKRDIMTKIIVLSSFYNPNYLGFVFKLGVSAFLPKEIDTDELIEIIRTVYSEGYYFDQHQMKVLRGQVSVKTTAIPLDKKDTLTSRETEVLKLICHQLTTKEIGERLFVSKKTVETHRSNLLIKTGARNTAGLIIFATQNNLIDPNEIML